MNILVPVFICIFAAKNVVFDMLVQSNIINSSGMSLAKKS